MSKHKKFTINSKLLLGRDVWCQLPKLDIPAIKAKVDTGARTSAIHAFNIEAVTYNKQKYVNFEIHPLQRNKEISVKCRAPIFDERYIMSSNGHKEHRYVILTQINIASILWEIQLTLSNRDPLRYRMLLGREALNHRVIVDPGLSCNHGKPSHQDLLKLYLEV